VLDSQTHIGVVCILSSSGIVGLQIDEARTKRPEGKPNECHRTQTRPKHFGGAFPENVYFPDPLPISIPMFGKTSCCRVNVLFSNRLLPLWRTSFVLICTNKGGSNASTHKNIDGLHTHQSLGIPDEVVVECHGSIWSDSLVLHGDSLPERFFRNCRKRF